MAEVKQLSSIDEVGQMSGEDKDGGLSFDSGASMEKEDMKEEEGDVKTDDSSLSETGSGNFESGDLESGDLASGDLESGDLEQKERFLDTSQRYKRKSTLEVQKEMFETFVEPTWGNIVRYIFVGGPIPYAEDDPRRDRGLIYLSEKKREEELALKNAQKARDKKARRKKRKTTEGEEVEREEEVEEEEENEEDIPLPPLIIQQSELDKKFEAVSGGSETVEVEKAAHVARLMGFAPSQAEIAVWKKENEGKATKAELEDWMDNKLKHREDTVAHLMAFFQHLDKEGTDSLQTTQVRNILRYYGEQLTDEEADQFLRRVGIIGDVINYKELCRQALECTPKQQ